MDIMMAWHAIKLPVSTGWSTALVQAEILDQLEGLPQHLVQTVMFPSRCIVKTLVNISSNTIRST